MATISENLQTIKDSTESIKQAIIDKGGTIEGDITTWASAISSISGGGGSSDEEITFIGTISWNMLNCTLSGNLSGIPESTYQISLCAVFRNSSADTIIGSTSISMNTSNISITCDYGEPPRGIEIPALFIAYVEIGSWETKIIPVKFIKKISTDPA